MLMYKPTPYLPAEDTLEENGRHDGGEKWLSRLHDVRERHSAGAQRHHRHDVAGSVHDSDGRDRLRVVDADLGRLADLWARTKHREGRWGERD